MLNINPDNPLITGLLLLLAAAATGHILNIGPLSTATTSDTSIVSYCGQPDWFDQFNRQNGYTPARQCTGVKIAGYRIDMEKTYYIDGWGCWTQYTIYDIQDDGTLDKIQETDGWTTNPPTWELDGLTVQTKAGHRFASYDCQWIQTAYEPQIDGSLHFETDVPDTVERGDTVDATVQLENQFDHRVSGTAHLKFCAGGPFGGQSCTSHEEDVSVASGRVETFTVEVPSDAVQNEVDLTTRFDGQVELLDGWQGVNFDCTGDGQINPVSDCDGLSLQSDGSETDTVTVQDPSLQSQLATLLSTIDDRVRVLWADITGKTPDDVQ